jgi:hypothetical protein
MGLEGVLSPGPNGVSSKAGAGTPIGKVHRAHGSAGGLARGGTGSAGSLIDEIVWEETWLLLEALQAEVDACFAAFESRTGAKSDRQNVERISANSGLEDYGAVVAARNMALDSCRLLLRP